MGDTFKFDVTPALKYNRRGGNNDDANLTAGMQP